MTISPERPCARLWRHPAHCLALGFGAGCAPRAPGTWGTLAGVPPCWLLQHLPLGYYLLLVILAFALGVWVCGRTGQALGAHDHPSIVWDEMVGYCLAMTAAPSGWLWLLLGFGLFRLFDILKPWPVSVADRRLGGGFGAMADDALAGVYAGLALQGLALV